MNALQYSQGIRLTTLAAMKSGVTLPEIIGVLEIAKQNVMDNAKAAKAAAEDGAKIERVPAIVPPGVDRQP